MAWCAAPAPRSGCIIATPTRPLPPPRGSATPCSRRPPTSRTACAKPTSSIPTAMCGFPTDLCRSRRLPVPMQRRPELLQPGARLLHAPRQLGRELPEARPVVELLEVRHFVRDHVVEHGARRQDQAPREGQMAARRAAAPAALGIADGDAGDAPPDRLGL